MLQRGSGRYRRVLAYCNTVDEAKRFQEQTRNAGLVAWHINGDSPDRDRQRVLQEFAGTLQGPVHVLVTVQVLGEGVNIGNADTCIFVEPRRSYVAILQAMGRVLRRHPNKPLAHVILPAVPETYLHGGGERSPVAVPVGGLGGKTRSLPASSAGKAGRQLPNIETIVSQETVDDTPSRSQEMISTAGIPRRRLSTTPDARQTVLKNTSVIPRSVVQQFGDRSTGPTASSRNGDHSFTEQNASSFGEEVGQVVRNGRPKAGARLTTGLDIDKHSVQEEYGHSTSELDGVTGGTFVKFGPLNCEGSGPELFNGYIRRSSVPEPAGAEVNHSSDALFALRLGTTPEESIPSDTTRTRPPEASSRLRRIGPRERSLKLTSAGIPALGELGRFLQVLAAADSRLADSLLQDTPSGCFRFIDARGLQPGALDIASTPEVILKVWNQLSSMARGVFTWMARFKEINEFCKTYGYVPRYDTKDEPEKTLGIWLHNQHGGIRSGRIGAERRQALLNACPMLAQRIRKWAERPDDFTFKLQELVALIDCNGRLPRSTDSSVASWICQQGRRFRAGQLTADKLQRLERIELLLPMLKSWHHDVSSSWTNNLDKLRVHMRRQQQSMANSEGEGTREHSTQLPRDIVRWLWFQRKNYRDGTLNEYQVVSLMGEGVSLQARRWQGSWDDKLHRLTKIICVEGRLPTSETSGHHGRDVLRKQLYQWIRRQVNLHLEGKLDSDRLSALKDSHPLVCDLFRDPIKPAITTEAGALDV
ncbi:unnamed protein product, partial [Polarella glacialis]